MIIGPPPIIIIGPPPSPAVPERTAARTRWSSDVEMNAGSLRVWSRVNKPLSCGATLISRSTDVCRAVR